MRVQVRVLTWARWLCRCGSLSAGSADTSTERERVTLRASFANLDRPATHGTASQYTSTHGQDTEGAAPVEGQTLASLGVVGVDGLLEGGDVAEGEQEQHDQLALVPDRRHVHQQPQRRACRRYIDNIIQGGRKEPYLDEKYPKY